MSSGGGAGRGSGSHATATISVAQTAPIRIHHLTETLCEDEAALRRSLPQAAEHALRLCGGRSVDAGEIERALAVDVPRSASLVAVAGAGLFAPRAAIADVRGAVMHLGLEATRDALLLDVLNGIAASVPGFEARAEELRRRALAAALAGRLIAETLNVQSGHDYLVGLLHDVGELVLLQRATEEGILPPGVLDDPTDGPLILQAIEADHARVGAAICRSWGLPPAVAEAAEFHHDRRARGRGRLPSQLAAATDVIAAHVLATPSQVREADRQPIFAEVGLSPAAAATVIASVEAALPGFI
jgi:putative nucleotidyltransferase with HDIG domain